jgi:ATP-dependent Lhr-like helicase
MHTQGRRGLLHRDGVGRRVMARKRARITAITGGGAIPDVADYRVLQSPEGLFVGTLNEDFAVESNVGDIFQLGNTSWRVLKVERGTMHVSDAQGQPPSIPFWLGEGPSRTPELSAEIGQVREECADPLVLQREIGLSPEAAIQIAEYITEGRRVLGTVPTQKRVVLERFFDESGGMQMVLHAPFAGRINRGWGLALRKRFCRGFGFELQAAANEEAIVISLGLQHSFPLEDVFDYLHPNTVRKVLTQAVLDQPMFESRWRWNATRSLVLERFQNGKPVPPQILRMRAGDLLAAAFPAAVACPENMPAGDLPIPMEHPLVRQTIGDCLTESTDVAGLIEVLKGLADGSIERVAIDTAEPSAFARGILSSELYTFLDDAPLEERRTQAVMNRRSLDVRSLDGVGALDPAAVERVRQEAWPQPESAEEVHDALLWMGFITDEEATDWLGWLALLATQNRVNHVGGRWSAVDGTSDPKQILLGRLEALGPLDATDPRIAMAGQEGDLLRELERDGAVLQTRLDGATAWCERRLLARIHRYTVERLRREIEPVTAGEFLRFLACWQHVDAEHRLEGPRGVSEVLRQLAGFQIPAWAWESHVLPNRVRDYRREWLDELTLSGEFVWGRLWGGGASAVRVTPLSFVPRDDLDAWLSLAQAAPSDNLGGPATELLNALSLRGAMFTQNLQKATDLLPGYVDMGLASLLAHGLVTCDSFASLRQIITPPSRRRRPPRSVGRWSCFRVDPPIAVAGNVEPDETAARQLLQRTGVVFRRTTERERLPIPWSKLSRIYRRMELRGEIRGGRFVAGFSGEQFALPGAIEQLRKLRRDGVRESASVISADPLNFQGILTPADRVPLTERRQVMVG